MEIKSSEWITVSKDIGDIAPVFRRAFDAKKAVEQAMLEITTLGVYEATLNGRRVGDFALAPGWTSYQHRLQVQTYDVTDLLQTDNDLRVTVGRGWFRSPVPGWIDSEDKRRRYSQPCGLIAHLTIRYADGSEKVISTDEGWQWAESPVRFSEIYDGERYDARVEPKDWQPVSLLDWPKDILIPQEGEIVRETGRIAAKRVFRTPKGETVVDFGQEVTGYVEFTVNTKAGNQVKFTHGEVLDADGNFYNANYRSAKATVEYICQEDFRQFFIHMYMVEPRVKNIIGQYHRLRGYSEEDWPLESMQKIVTRMRVTARLRESRDAYLQKFNGFFTADMSALVDWKLARKVLSGLCNPRKSPEEGRG